MQSAERVKKSSKEKGLHTCKSLGKLLSIKISSKKKKKLLCSYLNFQKFQLDNTTIGN